MEEDWEQIADAIDVNIPPPANPKLNKWDGEDEEEEVKDNWEDEEDEEKKDEEKLQTPVSSKPKKTLEQKLAEKELQKKELLRKQEEELANMTPEEKLNEKLRIQKLQEESDLKTALETFGIGEKGIDNVNPTTKEEFFELAESISKKVFQYKQDEEYINFLEELVRNICASLSSNNIRKIKTTIDNLFLEKQKLEKGDKPKKGKGSKVKARLRIEGENTVEDFSTNKYDDYDEYDDFM